MNRRAARILALIRRLESDLEAEMARHRLELCYTVSKDKVQFEEHVLRFHKTLRSNWLRYVLEARPAVLLTAPLIYATCVPFALLDLCVSIYQAACFRVYGIARVSRSEHMMFDRSQLAYLNWFERFNCRFCAYANGVISYAREIASRTEQYWCPIKHSRRILGAHERYQAFCDFGDATAYAEELAGFRDELKDAKT